MAQFPSTQWSLIRRSGGPPSARRAAFGELATAYRDAIFAFFRARLDASAAADATQSFLAASYEHSWWSRADADTGSFRGFLLLLLRRHRGHLLDQPNRELEPELADPGPAADRLFDARFALALTARAVDALRMSYRERDRGRLFEQLLVLLGSPPQHGELQHIAATLEMPANTLTVELQRLRKRLREQLRAELKELCADEAAFDADWSAMQHVLGGIE